MIDQETKLERILSGHSQRDLEDWLNSPFWLAFKTLIEEETEANIRDLVEGDIEVQSRDKEGILYRNDDQLRGGLIAMRYMVQWGPDALREGLQIAWERQRAERNR